MMREVSAYDHALQRVAHNIRCAHLEMLKSAERQVDELCKAMLRTAAAMESQKASALAFGIRRPRKKHLLWFMRPPEEKEDIENEFVALTTNELKYAVTMTVEKEPNAYDAKNFCWYCSSYEKRRFHERVPTRSAKAAKHISYLLDVNRRCINAIQTRTAAGLQYSDPGTLSIEHGGDLNDQIATGRDLSRRIIAELRAAVDRVQRDAV